VIFWITAAWQLSTLFDSESNAELAYQMGIAGHVAAAGALVGIPIPQITRFFKSVTVHVLIITCWSILESIFALIPIVPLQIIRFAITGIYFPHLTGFLVSFLYLVSWEFLAFLICSVSVFTGCLIFFLLLIEKALVHSVAMYLNIGLLIVVMLFLVYPIATIVMEKCHMKRII